MKVAVMNSSKEITEVLELALNTHGFQTTSIFTYEFKNHEKNFDAFIKKYAPQVILYDIAIPYKENYELFKRLSGRATAHGIGFVLTTTNKEKLEEIVGPTGAHEIVGKPFDLMNIINAVRNAQR